MLNDIFQFPNITCPISFGAITGLMFATAGDEQFIMLAMFLDTALLMYGILFLLGIIVGYLTDYFVKKLISRRVSTVSLTSTIQVKRDTSIILRIIFGYHY
jgi:hypothetical protein